MMSGVSYGTFALRENTGNSLAQLEFALNSNAVTDINTNQAMFAIAGYVDPPSSVPEPSTWVMTLAGFAGLGVVARHRAARRRAGAAG
jgi:PEP-CTERM motif